MTHTSTEQPELTTAQECADYATSLRSTAMTIKLEGRTPPASFLRAAELFERAATELNLKDARVQELEVENARLRPTVDDNSQDWARCDPAVAFHLIERHSDNWADAGKMMQEFADAKAKASQAQRVPLSEEQILAAFRSSQKIATDHAGWVREQRIAYGRALEAAHGITQEKHG